MSKYWPLVLTCLIAACGSWGAQRPELTASPLTVDRGVAPTYGLEVKADDAGRLYEAVVDYAGQHGFAVRYRDPPEVPPQSRFYTLRNSGAQITAFNPFDTHTFFFGIFADEVRAREICATLAASLAKHGLAAGPATDFGNPPPTCPER